MCKTPTCWNFAAAIITEQPQDVPESKVGIKALWDSGYHSRIQSWHTSPPHPFTRSRFIINYYSDLLHIKSTDKGDQGQLWTTMQPSRGYNKRWWKCACWGPDIIGTIGLFRLRKCVGELRHRGYPFAMRIDTAYWLQRRLRGLGQDGLRKRSFKY